MRAFIPRYLLILRLLLALEFAIEAATLPDGHKLEACLDSLSYKFSSLARYREGLIL